MGSREAGSCPVAGGLSGAGLGGALRAERLPRSLSLRPLQCDVGVRAVYVRAASRGSGLSEQTLLLGVSRSRPPLERRQGFPWKNEGLRLAGGRRPLCR